MEALHIRLGRLYTLANLELDVLLNGEDSPLRHHPEGVPQVQRYGNSKTQESAKLSHLLVHLAKSL